VRDGRRRLGAFGERLAAAHLAAKGYRILARNFRCREGEIDIVTQDGETLVFVEVRTRRGDALGGPAESVTASKEARLVAAATAYVQTLPQPPADQRIDVVAVQLSPGGRLLSIDHIQGAVSQREPA
jgi:putative endonuclease